MNRVILDTNIYGLIVVDSNTATIRQGIKSADVIIYGNSVIRKELRNTPKGIIDGINLRMDLLRIYQDVTKKELSIEKRENDLAEMYSKAYIELGGSVSPKKLKNDFLIVASASTHNLDIVVSEDNSTMLNELALRGYRVINSALKLKVPRFIGYEEFKNLIKR